MKRIYPIFHVSVLRRYIDPTRNFPKRAVHARPLPALINGQEYFESEAILRKRTYRKGIQYLVQWKGYGREEADWVDYDPKSGWAEDQWLVDAFELEALDKGAVSKSMKLSKASIASIGGSYVVDIIAGRVVETVRSLSEKI